MKSAAIAPTELNVNSADVALEDVLGTKSRPFGKEGLFLGLFQHRAIHFNVGIGTTSPSSGRLEIDSPSVWPIYMIGIGGRYLAIGPLNTSWAHFQTNATDGCYFYQYVYLAGGYGAASSRKLKKNIVPIDNALDKISKLNGVYFDWIADGKHGIGMIAEDVNKVVPEVVTIAKDNTIGLSYDKLVALTIEGIKEQQQQIEELKVELASLKGKVTSRQ